MYPDLHLVTYRQHERELAQRLERRRVARERAGSPSAAGGAPTSADRLASAAASVRAAAPRLAGRLARTRHAVREASTTTACCSPA